MKISLCSDLHLEFGNIELPGGDILILAGDICEAVNLNRHIKFFTEECAKYNHVLYVMGNHEHYLGAFNETYDFIKQRMPDNVIILENESVKIDDVLFIGATLWTDMNKENPVSMFDISKMMNDYRLINYAHGSLPLTPSNTIETHKASREYIKNTLNKLAKTAHTGPIVVITHHAPSIQSVSEYYKDDFHGNGAYFSDLENLIYSHPEITYWVHGHMHSRSDYLVGNTRVLSNPRGYHRYEPLAASFDPSFVFEV
jgi:hypothetical protein